MASTLLTALRVYQWPKNLVVFAALIFGHELRNPEQVARSIAAFFVLCAVSSAVYLLNDLLDIKSDRAHPEKRNRPLASGALAASTAVTIMVLLAAGGLIGAGLLGVPFLIAVTAYVVLNVTYSLFLKHVLLVDVLAIAVSFSIRAVSGALVLHVNFSNWLVVCTLFFALFLALGKRRREIALLNEAAPEHRKVLDYYSVPFVDTLMTILAGTTLIAYTIYTCSPEVVDRFNTDKLYVTIPFVVYGLFRYLYLVHHMEGGGDPSKTLLTDLPILATVVSWSAVCIGIIYGR